MKEAILKDGRIIRVPNWHAIPYADYYADIHNRWNIPERIARDIIESHQRQLDYGIRNGVEKTLSDKVLSFPRDRRSPLQYYCNLIGGWTNQHLMTASMNDKVKLIDPGASVNAHGKDSDWQLRTKLSEISSVQDVTYDWSSGSRQLVEIQASLYGRRLDWYDHKENKVKTAKDTNGIFLWNDPVNDDFFIVTLEDLESAYYRPNPAYGGKYSYQLPISLKSDKFVNMLQPFPAEYLRLLGYNGVVRSAGV